MPLRILFAIFLINAALVSNAKKVDVYPTTENSLQLAIDAAAKGDVLIVHEGLYKQHDITINKKLTIKGENFPIIDGDFKYQLFLVSADSVVIEGFALRNTGTSSMTDMAGIKLQNVSHVVVRNNFSICII
jgi:nitrous oxidase accessory protein